MRGRALFESARVSAACTAWPITTSRPCLVLRYITSGNRSCHMLELQCFTMSRIQLLPSWESSINGHTNKIFPDKPTRTLRCSSSGASCSGRMMCHTETRRRPLWYFVTTIMMDVVLKLNSQAEEVEHSCRHPSVWVHAKGVNSVSGQTVFTVIQSFTQPCDLDPTNPRHIGVGSCREERRPAILNLEDLWITRCLIGCGYSHLRGVTGSSSSAITNMPMFVLRIWARTT
ncbi:hypothetical protein B0H21DRAFT_546099 [Amylocystis lapponica]|nr:hypothetical protein B0H21DRAFT_546099 [Amylocystis lapponica]